MESGWRSGYWQRIKMRMEVVDVVSIAAYQSLNHRSSICARDCRYRRLNWWRSGRARAKAVDEEAKWMPEARSHTLAGLESLGKIVAAEGKWLGIFVVPALVDFVPGRVDVVPGPDPVVPGWADVTSGCPRPGSSCPRPRPGCPRLG